MRPTGPRCSKRQLRSLVGIGAGDVVIPQCAHIRATKPMNRPPLFSSLLLERTVDAVQQRLQQVAKHVAFTGLDGD